jgi:type I restriction enzyme R subunit
MKFKFDKVVDDLLLDFIGTKLDLYIKLMEPKINMLFKSKWFEVYRRKNAYN